MHRCPRRKRPATKWATLTSRELGSEIEWRELIRCGNTELFHVHVEFTSPTPAPGPANMLLSPNRPNARP